MSTIFNIPGATYLKAAKSLDKQRRLDPSYPFRVCYHLKRARVIDAYDVLNEYERELNKHWVPWGENPDNA